jgi:putative SOS response-associated peptidase YedK
LRRLEPDSGVTNIRNLASPHWRRWLDVEHRCVVPVTSFAEPEPQPDGSRPPAWFARDASRPLMFFAGIHVHNWTSVRKIKFGLETDDLFAFLTCAPNSEVAGGHEKAMPVVLTTTEEVHTWLTAPIEEALKLQRPLPDGTLKIVARGERRGDPPELAAQMSAKNAL